MKNLAAVVFLQLACAIPGAALASTADEALIEKAKGVVSYDMRDPAATQFREVAAYHKVSAVDGTRYRVVCGEYNAKNAYGAYTGFKRFHYDDKSGSAILEAGDGGPIDQVFHLLWDTCHNDEPA